MMNNNNILSSSPSSSFQPAKDAELKAFESSFFPAGGAPILSKNVPTAPPAPKNWNNKKSSAINLKTRNWGPKLDNGFSGLNRSLFDQPSGHHHHHNNISNFNIPKAPSAPKWKKHDHHRALKGKHLRLRNWGYPTENGWSGMNRDLYNNGLNLELNVIINELWAKFQPKNINQQPSLDRGISEASYVDTTLSSIPSSQFIATPAPTTARIVTTTTTVSVPMLNPPLNDGRRYAKLYQQNTSPAVASLVNRRGTRRDHLVQPNTSFLPVTPAYTAPGFVPVNSHVPTKREVRKQQRLARKAQKRGTGFVTPSTLSGGIPLSTGIPLATATPLTTALPFTTVIPQTTSIVESATSRGFVDGIVSTTGLIGPVSTTVVGGQSNVFTKQPYEYSSPLSSLSVGNPIM